MHSLRQHSNTWWFERILGLKLPAKDKSRDGKLIPFNPFHDQTWSLKNTSPFHNLGQEETGSWHIRLDCWLPIEFPLPWKELVSSNGHDGWTSSQVYVDLMRRFKTLLISFPKPSVPQKSDNKSTQNLCWAFISDLSGSSQKVLSFLVFFIWQIIFKMSSNVRQLNLKYEIKGEEKLLNWML